MGMSSDGGRRTATRCMLALDRRVAERAYRALAGQPPAYRQLLTGYTCLTQRRELWLTLLGLGLCSTAATSVRGGPRSSRPQPDGPRTPR
jgi:hypothetical protein